MSITWEQVLPNLNEDGKDLLQVIDVRHYLTLGFIAIAKLKAECYDVTYHLFYVLLKITLVCLANVGL